MGRQVRLDRKSVLYYTRGNSLGGSQIHALDLLRYCSGKNLHVFIVILGSGPVFDYAKTFECESFNVVCFKGSFSTRKWFKYLISLRLIVMRHKIELVYVCDFFSGYLSFGIPAKIFWHHHNRPIRRKWFSALLWVKAARIGLIDEIYLNSVPCIHRSKITVIPNYLNCKRFGKYKPKIIERGITTFAIVGKLSFDKGLADVINMVDELMRLKLKFRLLLIGCLDYTSDKECPELLQLVNRSGDYIKVFPRCISWSMYLPSDTVVVCPSRIDSFGRVIIESRVLGLRVVCSQIQGHLIAARGLRHIHFYKPGDHNSLVATALSTSEQSKVDDKRMNLEEKQFLETRYMKMPADRFLDVISET